MSRADDIRMRIAEIEDDIVEALAEDDTFYADTARDRLTVLRVELAELGE